MREDDESCLLGKVQTLDPCKDFPRNDAAAPRCCPGLCYTDPDPHQMAVRPSPLDSGVSIQAWQKHSELCLVVQTAESLNLFLSFDLMGPVSWDSKSNHWLYHALKVSGGGTISNKHVMGICVTTSVWYGVLGKAVHLGNVSNTAAEHHLFCCFLCSTKHADSIDLELEVDPLNVDHFSCTPLVRAETKTSEDPLEFFLMCYIPNVTHTLKSRCFLCVLAV